MGGLIARRVDKAPSAGPPAGPEGAKGVEGDGGEVVGEVAVVDDGVGVVVLAGGVPVGRETRSTVDLLVMLVSTRG